VNKPSAVGARSGYADTKTDGERRFYGSPEWKRLRAAHRRNEPLCRECAKAGIDRLGDMVDHIIPIRRGGDPLDDRNLQTLCHPHHDAKRRRERLR